MASESREEQSVSVDLSAELDEWLDEQAERNDTSREDVIRQLLEIYHATDTLDETAVEEIQQTVEQTVANEATKATRAVVADRLESELPDRLDDEIDERVTHLVQQRVEQVVQQRVEQVVQQRVEQVVQQRVEQVVDEQLADAVDTAITDRLPSIADAVESRLDERVTATTDEMERDIQQVESTFQDKIEDVRERIIQVKKETDTKAPRDHSHPELDRLDELDAELEEIGTELLTVRDELDDFGERVDDTDETVTEVLGRLDDTEDKLKRVAWVVSDLREDTRGKDSHERAVARIKRAAAQEGITSARCEKCSESVEIALLTEPECPHCNAAVSDVRPDGGLFRTKARLVTAAELEAGESE